jgi:glycosyltransferase involved in cell wall biosynthesis
VLHHKINIGYGEALKTGLRAAKFEYVLLTDGDDEYDVYDVYKLLKVFHNYDLVITFRYRKLYSNYRIFVSYIYNSLVRFVLRTRFRDISTGLRLLRKSIIEDLDLISNSPFIGAEITIKSMLAGYAIGEVGIQTYPRKFGAGSSTSFRNIYRTINAVPIIERYTFPNLSSKNTAPFIL